MKRNILYYVPNKLQANPDILSFAKANNFKCTIVAKQSEFLIKYPNSAIITYNEENKHPFDVVFASMPKRNAIVVDTKHLVEGIIKFKARQKEIDDIKYSLLSFLEYINMPTTTSSYILIKHTLFYMIDNDIEKCSYKIINTTCSNLGLNWQEEKPLLRKYCKIWYLQNYKSLEAKYPHCHITGFKTLHFLNMLKSAYGLNYHKDTKSSLALLEKEIERFSANNSALLLNLFTDDAQIKES